MASLIIHNSATKYRIPRKRTPAVFEIPSSVRIVIVKRRSKQMIETLRSNGWLIVDVSTHSENSVWKRFAPTFPHGNIPVPGTNDKTSMTVRVWTLGCYPLMICSCNNEKISRIYCHIVGDWAGSRHHGV